MRTKALMRCSLTIILLLAACWMSVAAQEGRKEQIVVPMTGGYFVAFSTTPGVDTNSSPDGWSMTSAEVYFDSKTIRRVFIDSGGSMYFGYVLTIERVPLSRQFKVSVRPLNAEDEQELRARKAFQRRSIHPNYNAAGVSRSAAPQVIADGDTFALDVLVNPKTGDKVTDFVTVSVEESRLRETSTRDVAPRDFTLEDVEMKMINYQLHINGELVAGGKRSGACAGPVIWFHLQDRGRFIFSLKPNEGYDFQKIGTIERNKIKFTLNNDRYEWVSDTPVVGAGGPWNLYVLYDPNYVPDSFFLGVRGAAKGENRAASRLEELGTSYPVRRRAKASGFKNPPNAKTEQDEPETSPGAHLIIGAASRVENLLPRHTGSFAQPGLKDVYAKWLYEDVAYLISAEEVEAFKLLKTDEQREHFIEQFWVRRDTDPTTKDNEYRREHYMRFAYANENYSFGTVPGWRTDRGRIFITHGKPDEVERFPSGERWVYKMRESNQAIRMEFVDLNGNGEFRLRTPKQ